MAGFSLQTSGKCRFGKFEFDSRSGELRKQGRRIRLSGQPVQVLAKLLERPGEMVTRQELQHDLWPNDTFVNFEQSLNAAVKRLRQALSDSPQNPRFVETLARRGYRFIAPVSADTTEGVDDIAVLPPVRSLAVLPFDNANGDPETEYLSDGITESLINSLSRLPAVRVMARSTVFQYKSGGLDPRTAGRKLNVQAVLVGRVITRGDTLLIAVELVDVRDGWQIWGEQYNRSLSGIFALEEEISREISGKLRLRLSGEDQSRLSKRFTENTEAYQDYLKGRYHLNRVTEDGLRKAIECFESAVGKDGSYALAYSGLAECYGLLAFFGLRAPAEVMPKAKEAALKALEFDHLLAEAHVSLAGVHKSYDWDWPAAEREFRKALELDPNHAMAHRLYASFLAAMGRPAEALREIEVAHQLDPMSLIINMEKAWNLYMARRFDDAIDQATHTLELSPEFVPARHTLAIALVAQHRYTEAAEAFKLAQTGSDANPATLAGLGCMLAASGRGEEAGAILCRMREMSGRGYLSPYWVAMLQAGMGQADQALESLEEAHRRRDLWLIWLKTEPRFDGLRGNSRFQDLLRRTGLAGD
jgi:TolB-like protein/Tfp pilus assembly protein PilF